MKNFLFAIYFHFEYSNYTYLSNTNENILQSNIHYTHPTQNHSEYQMNHSWNWINFNEFNHLNDLAANNFSETFKYLINWIFSTKLFTKHLIYSETVESLWWYPYLFSFAINYIMIKIIIFLRNKF